jgi:HD superfamily phosphohydrolase
MFRQVYFHRTLRSAEAVLVSTLKRASQLLEQNALGFRVHDSIFEKLLKGEPVKTSEYLQLDDTDVTFYLKQWMKDKDSVLADLSQRFIHRKLFKAIDLELTGSAAEKFWTTAREIVAQAGLHPDYYLITDRAADIPYYGFYSPEGGAHSTIKEISQVSEVVRGMRSYKIDRVCFPIELSSEISNLISDCERK